MYYTIQKKINTLFIYLFILTAIILYCIYYFISHYTSWGFIGIMICFILIVMIVHLILSFLLKHYETKTIYKMLTHNQFALAKIKKATYDQTKRDLYFHNHQIYQIDLEIYTQDHQTREASIYEDVDHIELSSLPGYCYVTYDGNTKNSGLISTYILRRTPQVKDIVREYEQICHPHYLYIIKKHGLVIKEFKKQK